MPSRPKGKYPHRSCDGAELRALVDAGQHNRKLLQAIKKELKYRKSSRKNEQLMKQVEELLMREAQGTGTQPSVNERPETPTPKATREQKSRSLQSKETLFEVTIDISRRSEGRAKEYMLVQPRGSGFGKPAYERTANRTTQLGLGAQSTHIERFEVALHALIEEMKRKKSGRKRIELSDGVSVELGAEGYCYSFEFEGDEQLFEDAEVELVVGQKRGRGRIVSFHSSRLMLSVQTDFGLRIQSASLFIDNTALLVALRERLIEARDGEYQLNIGLADALISGNVPAASGDPACEAFIAPDLLADQRRAVEKALRSPCFYLWGPPGTGKTKTISTIVKSLFAADRRVLICSNTNQAVDQVLLKLCKELGKEHSALQSGHVLRLGKIAHDELRNEYEELITAEGISKRRTRSLRQRRDSLLNQLEGVDRRIAYASKNLASVKKLEEAEDEVQSAQASVDQQRAKVAQAEAKLSMALDAKKNAEQDLEQVKSAGFLRRRFLPTREVCETNLREAIASIDREETSLSKLQRAAHAGEATLQASTAALGLLRRSAGGVSPKRVREQLSKEQKLRSGIHEKLDKIKREIQSIEQELIPQARILGATLTKTYLKVKQLGRFDTVIIDEVSMAMLPSLYVAAGLATKRVIVSGDFRQLAPIVASDEEEVLNELAHDVFETAGIVKLCERREEVAHVQMLREQFRMADPICSLISQSMYGGELVTAGARESTPSKVPKPFEMPLCVVDTSRLHPFESISSTGSRMNLLHTLVTRNIALILREAGCILSGGDAGVCTPYAAQAALHRDVLKHANLELVTAGTVHRYQGDEKSLIILEFPESAGPAWRVGMFLQGTRPDTSGARLLNVAISRAKEHLVVVANLTHLNSDLPDDSLLRAMLVKMQAAGRVVDAREVLSLQSLPDKPARLGVTNAAFDEQALSVHDKKSFEQPLRADIARAQKSIIIYSAFFTPSRIDSYTELFRQKLTEGVAIRCVTLPPSRNGTVDPVQGANALTSLEALGVTIDLRHKAHENVLIVDQEVLWTGSLGILTVSSKLDETMVRTVGATLAREVMTGLSLTPTKSASDAGVWAAKQESPPCPDCAGRMGYHAKGKYGPYFICEDCDRTLPREKALSS